MNALIEVKPIDEKAVQDFTKKVDSFEKYSKLEVKTQTDYEIAIEGIKTIEAFGKALDNRRLEITRPIDVAKKSVMDLFKPSVEKCEQIARVLRNGVNAYNQAIERKAAEDRRKAQEEADKKEREERQKLLDKAQKAADKGNIEKAAELKEQAQNVTVVPKETPAVVGQPKGVGTRKVWKARVVEANLVPRAYLMVDEDKLAKQATATENTMPVPGVEFYSETITSIRK